MQILERKEADKLFSKYWGDMSLEWFKVEVLQDYSGEDDGPSLRSWLKGDKQTSIELMKKAVSFEWTQRCQQKLKKGVKLIRIHVVEEPYSEYLQWELEHYKNINIPRCGERVYLVKKSEITNLDIPAGDFMIFDNKKVAANTYDHSGLMIRQDFYDESDNISKFLELKEQLTRLAKPI